MPNRRRGFLVLKQTCADGSAEDFTPQHEAHGPVLLDASAPDFLGAEVMSNNTAELCAIGHALRFLHTQPVELQKRPALVRFDSVYAANSVQGIFNGSKNARLIVQCRKLLAAAAATREVRFEHVKGHSNEQYNERADYLANLGAAQSKVLKQAAAKTHAKAPAPATATREEVPELKAKPKTKAKAKAKAKPGAKSRAISIEDDDDDDDTAKKPRRAKAKAKAKPGTKRRAISLDNDEDSDDDDDDAKKPKRA